MTKRNKQVRLIINIILAVWVLGLLALVLSSCNPVKQVLRDEYKMRKVWNEGALDGWCVNDTLIVSKSDTLISYDTLYSLDVQTDTFNIDREIVKVKTVVKTVRIRDTVTQTVKDLKLIDLLQKQNSLHLQTISKLKADLVNMRAENSALQKQRNKWMLYFWIVVSAVGIYLFRKPLLKLISPIKL